MSGRELWDFTRQNIVPDINEILKFFTNKKKKNVNMFLFTKPVK